MSFRGVRTTVLVASAGLLALAGAGCVPYLGGSSYAYAGATAAVAGAVTIAQVAAANREAERHWRPREGCGVYPDYSCYAGPDLPLEDAREHALHIINEVRRLNGAGALVVDFELDAFAQESSRQLAHDHRPHAHFRADEGACASCGESQGTPDGYPAGPVEVQIDEILDGMVREGPGGANHDNVVDTEWHRLGVGLVNPDGPMYLTLEFAP